MSRELTALLRPARRILVFTGAGISTASGIPDFRGPQGVWTRRRPVEFADFLASEEKRIEYWDYKLEAHEQFRGAAPNAVHRAIAKLTRLGRVQAVVTQNIDGLHQDAGTSPELVIELHGTNRFVECLSCGAREGPDRAMQFFRTERRAPRCSCEGLLKPATISFGQALRPEVLQAAARHAAQADLVLALGSTLSVQPAASLPLIALRAGAAYAIVNRGPTEHDELATLRLEGDVSEIVPPAVAALEAD